MDRDPVNSPLRKGGGLAARVTDGITARRRTPGSGGEPPSPGTRTRNAAVFHRNGPRRSEMSVICWIVVCHMQPVAFPPHVRCSAHASAPTATPGPSFSPSPTLHPTLPSFQSSQWHLWHRGLGAGSLEASTCSGRGGRFTVGAMLPLPHAGTAGNALTSRGRPRRGG